MVYPDEVRTAELAASVSFAADIGVGQPLEHGLRTCLLALRLADCMGLSEADRRATYYVALLRWAGCTSDARVLSEWFGNDIVARRNAFLMDFANPIQTLTFMARHAGSGRSLTGRAASVVSMMSAGPRAQEEIARGSCEVSRMIAARLGLDAAVQGALAFTFERWDGKGVPTGASGDEIPLPSRLVQVADIAEVLARGTSGHLRDELGHRSGRGLDPSIVDRLLKEIGTSSSSANEDSWSEALGAEPGPITTLKGRNLDAALGVFADFADLKSRYMAGHSRAVAELAGAATAGLGRNDDRLTLARRAGFVHDLGTVGLPNSILDKPKTLSHAEWEQVRLHTYVTERILSRSRSLAPIGAVASLHHERLDGSGYHRGSTGVGLSQEARVLGAAEAYRGMTEARAHRPGRLPAEAASELRAAAKRGEIDGPAVEAILAAAGHQVHLRKPWPFGLTEREVDVVKLIAAGLTTSEIARALSISAKTADHHVQHIYGKLDLSSRPGVALIAMEHGLIDEGRKDREPSRRRRPT